MTGGSAALRIAARLPDTEAEGPYLRYALWLQGCSLACPGCCNPEMLSPHGGTLVGVEALLREIREAPGIEGVTLLGGEPFEQAGPLALLAGGVRRAGLGVMAFSGYTLHELRARPGAAALLAEVDLLVDGRYRAAERSSRRRFVGSANQRLHFLTDRYRALDDGAGGIGAGEGPVEVRIRGGALFVSGAPDAGLLAALRAGRREPDGDARGAGPPLTPT
ncbi:MAG: radical SAM protein [Deltaproteobacteria bacterium]|nr:radical SAM protein [Deltaproteobacteria bacterium]